MKQIDTKVLVFFIYYGLIHYLGYAQLGNEKALYYQWFDTLVGIENTPLHYGELYLEEHRQKTKKTKFFPSYEFVLGSVIFDGQPYPNLVLNYNVYDDELLLQVAQEFGGGILNLYKPSIEEFEVSRKRFLNLHETELTKEIQPGFYELTLKTSNFTLLKKHRKKIKRKLDDTSIFYEFDDVDKTCVLYYQKTYYPIKRFSDLAALFPAHKKQLTNFHKTKENNEDFDVKLQTTLQQLDSLLTGEKTKS